MSQRTLKNAWAQPTLKMHVKWNHVFCFLLETLVVLDLKAPCRNSMKGSNALYAACMYEAFLEVSRVTPCCCELLSVLIQLLLALFFPCDGEAFDATLVPASIGISSGSVSESSRSSSSAASARMCLPIAFSWLRCHRLLGLPCPFLLRFQCGDPP